MPRMYALLFAVLAASRCSRPQATRQDWPSKPVRILIGFGAGGGTDVATRIVAEGLSELLGQQFAVENRPGAGGTIAGGLVAQAPNDGYTIGALSMGHSVSAVMVKSRAVRSGEGLRADRHLHQFGFRGGGRRRTLRRPISRA